MRFALQKIKWDTEGERIPDLPKKMDIEIDDNDLDSDDVASLVVNAATDQIGWLVEDAEVKAYVDTAPPGFDARAFNKGTAKKPHRIESIAAFDDLGSSTCISLKRKAEQLLKVAKPEVMRIEFEPRNLDPELEPVEVTKKIDEWVSRGDRYIYILEADSDLMLDRAWAAFSDAKSRERDGRAYARLNQTNKVLYVGSSSSLGRRFREHLGYGARATYALHICQWARGLFPMSLFLIAARYPAEVDPELLGLMEDQLWDTLRPMFGRRGRR
jgi:hypothetical protein